MTVSGDVVQAELELLTTAEASIERFDDDLAVPTTQRQSEQLLASVVLDLVPSIGSTAHAESHAYMVSGSRKSTVLYKESRLCSNGMSAQFLNEYATFCRTLPYVVRQLFRYGFRPAGARSLSHNEWREQRIGWGDLEIAAKGLLTYVSKKFLPDGIMFPGWCPSGSP